MTHSHSHDPTAKTVEAWIREGAVLVNLRKFHEAHHSFEQPWRHIGGPLRPLCQAMVQVAALGHHLDRGHRKTLVNLIHRARPRLELFSPTAVGFRIDLLIEDLDRLEGELAAGGDPASFTRPRLRQAE